MAISSAQIQLVMAATANESAGITTRTAQTAKRDTITFANGTSSACATGVIDANITIASNSTTVALSSLTDTLENAFGYTMLKGLRINSASTNSNITLTSNVSGIPNYTFLPNETLAMLNGYANGHTIASCNTITVAGVNNDVLTVTLVVS